MTTLRNPFDDANNKSRKIKGNVNYPTSFYGFSPKPKGMSQAYFPACLVNSYSFHAYSLASGQRDLVRRLTRIESHPFLCSSSIPTPHPSITMASTSVQPLHASLTAHLISTVKSFPLHRHRSPHPRL